MAPEQLRQDVERARAPVDFCVAALYLTLVIGLALLAFAVADSVQWLISAFIAFALLPLWYSLAVTGTGYWYTTVQALVNLGRVQLATALNLAIPTSIERERELWHRLSSFVRREYAPTRAARLEPFRHGQPWHDAAIPLTSALGSFCESSTAPRAWNSGPRTTGCSLAAAHTTPGLRHSETSNFSDGRRAEDRSSRSAELAAHDDRPQEFRAVIADATTLGNPPMSRYGLEFTA